MAKISTRTAGWLGFTLLLAGCAAAWWWTGLASGASGFPASGRRRVQNPDDERQLVIASAMSGLADTPEEQQLAQRAQATAAAMVQAAVQHKLAAQADEAEDHRGPEWARYDAAQAALRQEHAASQALAKQIAAAPPARRPRLLAERDLTQAQLQLDQARVEDARQDLRRARAAALMTPQQVAAQARRYQAAARQLAAKYRQRWRSQSTARNPETAQGLAVLFTSWHLLAAKLKALRWAQAQCSAAAAAAVAAHNRLHDQLHHAEAQNAQRMAGDLARLRQARRGAGLGGIAAQTQSAVHRAEELAEGQRRLIALDHAAERQRQLAGVYRRWVEITLAQQELAMHDALGMWLEILSGFAVLLILDWLAGRAARRWRAERRRVHTVRHLTRFVLGMVALIWLLLIAVGKPAQWLTFLGLAGAGLTVALEDTIISFAGWFVVIGRRGVTPGDWVEINGVNGEVVEITLLRTVLQEAGNWTEPGHATGRRVYLPNSFVFTGPYFNFSTRGQWLWDEIRLAPVGGAPWTPQSLAAIAALVAEETRADAALAAKEWEEQHREPHPRGRGGSAPAGIAAAKLEFSPVVQIKPSAAGGDLCIRYITTAATRAMRRESLYRRIFHQRGIVPPPAATAASSANA